MVREFSEEKRQGIFRLLDEIDMKDWKPFMEWCGSRAEEFGDWPEKLGISKYTRYVDEYQQSVLDLNERARQQLNTVFENVAEIDARYAARMRECQEKIKEQIAIVKTMTEFMDSMTNGNPNMSLLTKGSVNENCIRTEEAKKEDKEIASPDQGWQGKQPEVVVLDIPGAEVRDGMVILPPVNNTIEVIERETPDGIVAEFRRREDESVEQEDDPVEPDEDMEILERYLNEEFFTEALGWNLAKRDERLGDHFLEDMRSMMAEYGLTDEKSIINFLMTVTVESDYGQAILEYWTGKENDELSYTFNTRGAGPIQITGPDQEEFLKYILERTEDEDEIVILNRYINNFKDIDPSEDGEVWDNPLQSLNWNEEGEKLDVELPPVAEYIAENYAMESALWYWCVYPKVEIDRELLSLNESVEAYGDGADPFMMYVGIQCAVNGSEFKPRGIGRFLRPWNRIEISDELYIQEIKGEDGEVIGYQDHEDGSIILYYSDADNGEDGPKETAQTYKPYDLPKRIAVYERVTEYIDGMMP